MNSLRIMLLVLLLASTYSMSLWAFEGFLEPAESVDLASVETGVIGSMKVKEGDEIKAGGVIAILDYQLIDASLQVANAKKKSNGTILGAQAEWDISKEKLEQFERLYTTGSARKDELLRARLDEKISAAKLTHSIQQQEILELEYKRIQAQIERHFIRSPINGIVVTLNRKKGELVSVAQGPFVRVVNISQLKLVTNLSHADAQSIAEGDIVKVVLYQDNIELEGKVDYISKIIDPTSGTTKVVVMINKPGDAMSGYAARLVIE